MRKEKNTSVRIPEDLKEELIERYGSLRGAILSMYKLQLIADQVYIDSLKKEKKK